MRTPEAHHITPVQPPSMVRNSIMMRTPDVQPMRPSVMQQSRNSFSVIEGSINPHQEDAGFNVSGLIQDSTSMSTSPQPVRSRVSRSNSQNTSMSMSPRPVRIRRPPAYLKDYLTGGGVLFPVKRRRGRPPKSEQLRQEIVKFKCETCPREFNTLPGLQRHESSCRKMNPRKGKQLADDSDGYTPNVPIYNKQLNINQILEGTLEGDQVAIEAVDVKDPYAFEEGRCHCCGEDIETAHMGGEFECTECQKLFRLKSSLERHRRVIHNEGDSYKCPECDARCPDKGTLARHMYTHTGLKPVSCPVCNTMFSRKYHLIRHNYQTGCDGSKRPTFPCQVCGRVFNRKDNLREHLRAHAGQTKRKKRYTCEECNEEFVGLQTLTMHRRSHTGDKPWPCDFCPKQFPSQGALKKHRRKHTGERPYECSYCYARFAAKETLNRHLRTHTGVKPHTCQYCGKGFIQASQLRAHIFHHSGTTPISMIQGVIQNNRGFTCDQCGKSFNRKQRLQLHVKYVHEGAEPFRCDTCSRTFLRKEDLARHQLLHSGVKEHKCPICGKAFAMKSSLKIHLLTHTKEPPRSCDECGRAFIRQDCLLRHMRTKHRDMLEEIMQEAEKKKLQQQLLAAANQAAQELPTEEPHVLTEDSLAENVRQLLTLLVDETTLKAFGWPDASVDKLLEAVIRRCGHQPAGFPDMPYADRLRENAKLLFTVVIDDNAVKTLLNNQTVDEVILHVLRLAKP
ncbi:oocyte zinc finger protein XlCOF6-like [Macrosteles quadrilineatus]|uniref:oocyte zinc finger protein XlCOF6-like n=1 Tax=Macrosteles quadrilineatus TaxID=74068 RepID=UPI0023E0ADCF|nr:oocyte zinc finger protein XlCOF6-like [Macrosteles quadrilineatus]